MLHPLIRDLLKRVKRPAKGPVVITQSDDWIAVTRDGRSIYEGHSLNAFALEHILNACGVPVKKS